MVIRQPRYSQEEFARRGDEIYETWIRPHVEADNYGKIVAIDIESIAELESGGGVARELRE